MRWLKSIVIVLGILIVFCIVLLGYGFYKKISDPSWIPFSEQKVSISSFEPPSPKLQEIREPLKSFGIISLDLAEGCIITKVLPSKHYTYFIIGQKPTCNAVILVDPKKGVVLGRIEP